MTDLRRSPNHMDFNYLQRVKVYRLNDEGKWDDKGTGHVSVEYLERSDAVGLVVIDEEDNQTLLVHRISADDIYRRQEDTIISWTDPEVATDLALSFQETMGCSFIWDQICSVQRSIHFPSVGGLDSNSRPVGDDLEHSGTSQDDGGGSELLELPPVEMSTLPLIARTFAEVPPFDRDRVAILVARDQGYIRKLVQLFRTCEDLENCEGLRWMYKIVKGIISLNDGHIFDTIFGDEYIMDIVGALEYDPELTTSQDHRKFLKEQVTFKEAVPIHDQTVLSKIHQTYRIGYIKDVILPRVLDDQTFATINSIMLFNNVSVVSSLQNDNVFLAELFARLKSPETPEKNKRDLVFFVQEFCNLSKHLQPVVRSQLFSALVKEGLFDIVKDILKDVEESVRLSGCDILIVVLNHDPALLRSFLVNQTSHTLFSELVERMLTPSEGGLQTQLLEIMRMLLDSETMDTVRSRGAPPQGDKSMFLDVFYEKYMDRMVQVLTDGCSTESGSAESPKDLSSDSAKQLKPTVSPEILGNICELMCLCVQHHRFRIKYYVMRNQVVEKILKLTRRKEKYLVVAAVRFLRICISLKDEFYYRYIAKHNCFEPIIASFVANGNRYNLLNSAVLELIDFIRREGIKSLIVHLVEKYSSKLESIDYVDTFRALKLKYEQLLEAPPSTRDAVPAVTSGGSDHGSRSMRDRHNHAGLPDNRKRKDERALDKDEEDYFNEDSDDEEDTATARVSTSSSPQATKAVLINGSAVGDAPFRGSTFGLVDYDDEDEDMPAALGINGKGTGGVFEKKSDNLLPTTPIADPIWPEVEDVSLAKRKLPLAPSLEDTDATALKRQKPEEGRANEHSVNEASLSRIDSQGVGPSSTSGEVLGFTDPARDLPPVLACSELPTSPNNAKVHPFEDSKPAAVSSKDAETDTKKLETGQPTVSSLDHAGNGGSQNDTDATTGVDAEPSNRIPDMASSNPVSAPDSSETDGAFKSEIVKSSSHVDDEVSAPTATCGVVDGHDESRETMKEAGINGVADSPPSQDMDCKVVAGRALTDNGVGGCSGDDACNGTATDGSERVGYGTVSSKGSSGSNSGLLQQHNVSVVGSEGNKLTSLGTDVMRGVTPTSPGSYSVR